MNCGIQIFYKCYVERVPLLRRAGVINVAEIRRILRGKRGGSDAERNFNTCQVSALAERIDADFRDVIQNDGLFDLRGVFHPRKAVNVRINEIIKSFFSVCRRRTSVCDFSVT